jgi:D-tyrosyl-tRNA(Tyr) deacylase
MIGLLQRVTRASVSVDGAEIARIGTGLLVLVGVQARDTENDAGRLAERLAGYRVFPDKQGKMNLSVQDIKGEILLVPQFTLAADTAKGMRPSFHPAADPAIGQRLFRLLTERLQTKSIPTATGRFGADMEVSLVNDGPVTFWLSTRGTELPG